MRGVVLTLTPAKVQKCPHTWPPTCLQGTVSAALTHFGCGFDAVASEAAALTTHLRPCALPLCSSVMNRQHCFYEVCPVEKYASKQAAHSVFLV